MAAWLGNIAAAIAGDHRRNLDPVLLEFDRIGDDMFGDIVDRHWFLRGESCIDDMFAVRRVKQRRAFAPCPPYKTIGGHAFGRIRVRELCPPYDSLRVT